MFLPISAINRWRVFGKGGRPGWDLRFQKSLKPLRCEWIRVSGLTMTRTSVPAGPAAAERRPEESVSGVQFGPRPFPFQYGDLLSEGEDFEGRASPAAEEDADDRENGEDEFRHELPL